MGKLLISHRSTVYPCFIPDLGEFNRSWSYKTYPLQKYKFLGTQRKSGFNFVILSLLSYLCIIKKPKTSKIWKPAKNFSYLL